jgi:hypothetical protein
VIVAMAACARLAWAWRSDERWHALAASALGLGATVVLISGVFDVYSQAQSCSRGVTCDSVPLAATTQDALIALTLSIGAVAAFTLLTLICLEDLTRPRRTSLGR